MTIEELAKKLDDLERKVDTLRANSLQQNADIIAVESLRVKGLPNDIYYKVVPDNTNPASVTWSFTAIGKKGV